MNYTLYSCNGSFYKFRVQIVIFWCPCYWPVCNLTWNYHLNWLQTCIFCLACTFHNIVTLGGRGHQIVCSEFTDIWHLMSNVTWTPKFIERPICEGGEQNWHLVLETISILYYFDTIPTRTRTYFVGMSSQKEYIFNNWWNTDTVLSCWVSRIGFYKVVFIYSLKFQTVFASQRRRLTSISRWISVVWT